jgi:hypothetical protein
VAKKFMIIFLEKENIATQLFFAFSNFRTSWHYFAHKKNYGSGGLGWVYWSCDFSNNQ